MSAQPPTQPPARPPFALLAVDLDGTLLRSDHTIGTEDWQALEWCGTQGIVRVAATGRSYFSAQRVLDERTPLDYLVFSCGAGVLRWSDRNLLHAQMFTPEQAQQIGELLSSLGHAVMVHAAIPDNHIFWYTKGQDIQNLDLEARVAHYAEWVRGEVTSAAYTAPVTQFLVSLQCSEFDFEAFCSRFAPLAETIRSSSPFLPDYKWLELFPRGVNKGAGVAWLAKTLGIADEQCRVVGNDYNDLSMLERFPQSYVVANAPEALTERFCRVSDHNSGGVAEAINHA